MPPSPTTVRRLPPTSVPHCFCHLPARWLVTISGTRLASISTAMMPNSPAFSVCTPLLLSSVTLGGSQSNGASRSRPALVTKIRRSFGARQGNRRSMTPSSVTSASASSMPAAKSSSVSPRVTLVAAADVAGAGGGGVPLFVREQEQRVVDRVLDVDAHDAVQRALLWGRLPGMELPMTWVRTTELPPVLFRDERFVVLDKPAGLPVHPGPRGGASVEDFFPRLSRRKDGPWLAHRLDADTAGCLVVALRRAALLARAGGVRRGGGAEDLLGGGARRAGGRGRDDRGAAAAGQ